MVGQFSGDEEIDGGGPEMVFSETMLSCLRAVLVA